jgi:soluble epoxide hydrolase / lipid-phosphate phosphatase
MDTLTKKTIQTPRGFTYTYYVSPASLGKPTIYLIHGWPDSAALWEDLATKHLIPAGYGVILPDCLGYGGSSKPTDPQAYSRMGVSDDLNEILIAENIEKVIIAGHDWGSGIAHRFYVYHPERCVGLITLNLAVLPRQEEMMVLDVIEPFMIQAMGYFPFQYWYLFADPVNGPALADKHLESLFTAIHAEPEAWKETMCAKDGITNWLKQDKKGPVQAYATDTMKEDFIARYSRDGFTAPLCYYRAIIEGVFYEEEQKMPAERFKVMVPYLFVAGNRDIICRPDMIEQAKGLGLTPNLTVEEIDAGHWSMLAKPKEVGDALVRWLGNNF